MEKEYGGSEILWLLWLKYVNSHKPENLVLEQLCHVFQQYASKANLPIDVAFASWYILWRDPWIVDLCSVDGIELFLTGATNVLDSLSECDMPCVAEKIYKSSKVRDDSVPVFSMKDIENESLFLGIDDVHEYMFRVYG